MARSKNPPPGAAQGGPLTSNPFAALREQLGAEVPAAAPPAPAAPPPPKPQKVGPARAVVRLERKGRGGKECTIVEKLALKPAELEAWCKDLKRALGTGGQVEGEDIAIHGDQRERLQALLEARGVRKVTLG